jgi:hypothetical protein
MGRGMDWIDKAQDNDMLLALVNAAMNLRVPKCVEFLVCLRTYQPIRTLFHLGSLFVGCCV